MNGEPRHTHESQRRSQPLPPGQAHGAHTNVLSSFLAAARTSVSGVKVTHAWRMYSLDGLASLNVTRATVPTFSQNYSQANE